MTVKELRDWCNWYMKHGDGDIMLNDVNMDRELYENRCNREMFVIKDGTNPEYFSIGTPINMVRTVEIKPAVFENRKTIVHEEVQMYGNYHWEDKDGNECQPGKGHIVSNPPVYKDVEKFVPVQVEPPEYKKIDIVGIVI